MSEDFILNYFKFTTHDLQQVTLRLANIIYLRASRTSKYLKYSTQQYFKVVINQACMTAQSFGCATQYLATPINNKQQVLGTYTK